MKNCSSILQQMRYPYETISVDKIKIRLNTFHERLDDIYCLVVCKQHISDRGSGPKHVANSNKNLSNSFIYVKILVHFGC